LHCGGKLALSHALPGSQPGAQSATHAPFTHASPAAHATSAHDGTHENVEKSAEGTHDSVSGQDVGPQGLATHDPRSHTSPHPLQPVK
jgi:hypothetical protein